MKEVVPGVFMMDGLLGANVYLLQSGNGTVLVDSGMHADIDKILAQVGYAQTVISIVLTHFHGDHVGGAAELSKQWGTPVMAHKDDAPFIIKPTSIPAFSGYKQLMSWVAANVVLRSPPCSISRQLEDGDKMDALDGCVIIHTPGHTLGSICLYQPERQILLCGDAIYNENPVTRKPGMGLYLRRITLDNAMALKSVRKLSRLPIKVLCFGHGEPIVEGAGEQIEKLLANYPPDT